MNVTRKVRYGTAVTVGTGLVTWLLVTYVFHGSLPPDLATALPVIVASVLGAITAWWTKHAPQDLRRGVANLAVDVKDLTEQLQKIQTGSLPNSARPPQPRVAVGTTPWAAEPALQSWSLPAHPIVDIVQPPPKMHEPTTTLTGNAFTADGPIATGAGSTLVGKNVFGEDQPIPGPTTSTDLPDGMAALTPTEADLLHSVPPTYEPPVRPVPVATDTDGPPKVNQQAALGLDPYGVK